MKINISIIISILLIGCVATTPPTKTTIETRAVDSDSARTLIRRGMTGEARALLESSLTAMVSAKDRSAAIRLLADSWEKEANWTEASRAWHQAAERFPDSTAYRASYWHVLEQWAGQDSSLADSLTGVIRAEGDRFAAGVSLNDCYLAYFAAAILGDSVVVARGDSLIIGFPDSPEALDLVGERFWDGLYPIWNDNQPRIAYLRDFIGKYNRFSWRDPAWRMMIGIYAGLHDTAAIDSETARWVALAPDNPSVLYSSATFLYDYGGNPDSARVWAERAYRLKDRLTRPLHNPEEEWLLYGPQIRAGIPLLLAQIRFRDDDLKDAHKLAVESLNLADYSVDEYATPAPQHYWLGVIGAAEKSFDYAAQQWIDALIAGDVVNKFAGLADSALRANFGLKSDSDLPSFCRDETKYQGIVFTRVTDSVGLGGVGGSRVAWGDYDGDGDDDLLTGGSRLFRNDSGRFVDITTEVGLTAEGCHGGIWGDFDNDGDLDLFCFSSSSDSTKAERLFRNRTGETPPLTPPRKRGGEESISPPVPGGELRGEHSVFEDVTSQSGDIADSYTTEAAIWGDFNGDGRLDLFVPGYERPAAGASDLGNAYPSRMLIQDSAHVFHNLTDEYGLKPPNGRNLCARSPVTCDFDRDGDLDLYVGNYRLQENLFWINRVNPPLVPPFNRRGEGDLPPLLLQGGSKGGYSSFQNLAPWYEVDGEEMDGWWGHTIGCQWGDFDGDGNFDLIACNLAHPRYIRFSNRTMLYRNNGSNHPFTDVRRQWGIKYDECHSEPVFGDFDNDGDLDLYITCVYPDRRSYLYRNDGDHFTDITFLSGTRAFNGWGCATADYDNDGDLDLAVCANGKVELFRNDTRGGNWLELDIRDASVGTIIEMAVDGKVQIRQKEGGKGAGSQSSARYHFGLGSGETAVANIYTGGRLSVAMHSDANQIVRFDLKAAK